MILFFSSLKTTSVPEKSLHYPRNFFDHVIFSSFISLYRFYHFLKILHPVHPDILLFFLNRHWRAVKLSNPIFEFSSVYEF